MKQLFITTIIISFITAIAWTTRQDILDRRFTRRTGHHSHWRTHTPSNIQSFERLDWQ